MLVRLLLKVFLSCTLALLLILTPKQFAPPPRSDWHHRQRPTELATQVVPDTLHQQVESPPLTPPGAGLPEHSPPVPRQDYHQGKRPKVALLIDDMGYNQTLGQQLLGMRLTLNFSFLPQAPYTQELVLLAQQQERTILVHMPMEPESRKWKPEPVTLNTEDSQKELEQKVEKMLAAVPQASGANNHMGSRFTQNREKMKLVLGLLRRQHLFFVDSYTSGKSQGQRLARNMGIPTARRSVFLDNEQNVAAICKQLERVAQLAKSEQSAIAIGHPNKAMLTALHSCVPKMLATVELVSVEELVQ